MKCVNCFSSFITKPKILIEDIIEDEAMATWDDVEMYGYSIKDLGLKTCPFNANHKMKASQYSKHVLKCEQRFPKRASLKSDSICEQNLSRMASIESFFKNLSDGSDVTDLTKSMNQLNTCDDWLIEEQSIPSTSSASGRSSSLDSAIGMTNNSNSSGDNIDVEAEVHVSPQTSGLTDGNSGESSQQTQPSTDERSSESQVNPIVPQQVTVVPEPTTQTSDLINGDNGSGDSDNEWNSGKHFTLYEGFESFDDLTDDQIMEMATSFIDVVVLSKMSKTQRKQLNDKLIELRKSEKRLKRKAFNELVTFKEVWDPQLNDIPQEIRKPRIDVRELFNLNKKQNNRIDTIKSTTPVSPEPKKCPPNPCSAETSQEIEHKKPQNLNSESGHESGGCCSKAAPKQESERIELNSVCNSCWDPLSLNEENIKRMTVFCAKCSGVKFGGYFECHSCNLYGYFAKSQISQHLTKHFPQTN